jgi:hypothetical protein
MPGAPRHAASRPAAPASIDDNVGNRKPRETGPAPSSGNEPPRAPKPIVVDDDLGNR